MTRVRCRYLLPFGHTLIDCILLVAFVMHLSRPFGREGAIHPPSRARPVLLLQESDSFEWDPRTASPPGPFMLITSGNLPAGLISDVVRPEAGFVRRGQPWHHMWFLLQEAVASSCWFLIGLWIDMARPRLGKVMMAYLTLRLLLAFTGAYEIGWRIQISFWMGFMAWLVGLGIYRAIRLLPRTRTD
jgi:hypothetical protein